MQTNHSHRLYVDIHDAPITGATKIKIIETGIELFSQKGYSGVSVRDITGEVGIKESSLYKHFKSKEELIETIFFNFRKACGEILPPMDSLDSIIAGMDLHLFLERGWSNFKRHIDDPINQKTWRMIYLELFRHPRAMEIYRSEIVEKTIDCLELVFAKMAEAGKMNATRSSRVLAVEYQYPLFMLVMDYHLLRSQNESTEKVEQHVADHIEYFVETAGSRRGGIVD